MRAWILASVMMLAMQPVAASAKAPQQVTKNSEFQQRRFYRGVLVGLKNPALASRTHRALGRNRKNNPFDSGLKLGARVRQGKARLSDERARQLAGTLVGLGFDVSGTVLEPHVGTTSPTFLKGVARGQALNLAQHGRTTLSPQAGSPTAGNTGTTRSTSTTNPDGSVTITTTAADGSVVNTTLSPGTTRARTRVQPNPRGAINGVGNTTGAGSNGTVGDNGDLDSNASPIGNTTGDAGTVPKGRGNGGLQPNPAPAGGNGSNDGSGNGGYTQADIDAARAQGRRDAEKDYRDSRNEVKGWDRLAAGMDCAESAAYTYLYGTEALGAAGAAETSSTLGRVTDGLAAATSGLGTVQNCGAMLTGKYIFDKTGTFGRIIDSGQRLVRLAGLWKNIQARRERNKEREAREQEKKAKEATASYPQGTVVYDRSGVPGVVGQDGRVRPIITDPRRTVPSGGGGGRVSSGSGAVVQPQRAVLPDGRVVDIPKEFDVPGGPEFGTVIPGKKKEDAEIPAPPEVEPGDTEVETGESAIAEGGVDTPATDGEVEPNPADTEEEPKGTVEDTEDIVDFVNVLCDEHDLNCMWKQTLSTEEIEAYERHMEAFNADTTVPANVREAFDACARSYPSGAAPAWWLNMCTGKVREAYETNVLPRNRFEAGALGESISAMARARMAAYTQGCLNHYTEFIERTGQEATAEGQRKFFQENCFTPEAVEAVVNSGMTGDGALRFGMETSAKNLQIAIANFAADKAVDAAKRAELSATDAADAAGLAGEAATLAGEHAETAKNEADRATEQAGLAEGSANNAAESAETAKGEADRAKSIADQTDGIRKEVEDLKGNVVDMMEELTGTETRISDLLAGDAQIREDEAAKRAEFLAKLDEKAALQNARLEALTTLNAEAAGIGSMPVSTHEEIAARNEKAKAFNQKAEELGIDASIPLLDNPSDAPAVSDSTVGDADSTVSDTEGTVSDADSTVSDTEDTVGDGTAADDSAETAHTEG